jgi:transposase
MIAPVPAGEQLPALPQDRAGAKRLPADHRVDGGDIRARTLGPSRQDSPTDLIGPIEADRQWPAKAKTGFAVAHFCQEAAQSVACCLLPVACCLPVDWDAPAVVCPPGRQSGRWWATSTARGPMIHVDCSAVDGTPCTARALGTRRARQPRRLTRQPRAEHEAIQAMRQRQHTPEFAGPYAARAGIEGTRSPGGRVFGLRRARYRGLAKAHVPQVATAAALNVRRLADWLNGVAPAPTRRSRCPALAATG